MKAQFATIEALLSLFAVMIALALLHNASNGINAGMGSARSSLGASVAVYDFYQQLRYDPELQLCIAQYSAGNKSCILAYEGYYAKAYNLGYFGIYLGGSYGLPASSFIRCYPYTVGSNWSEICIGAA